MEQQCAASTSQDKLTKVAILHHQVNPYFLQLLSFPQTPTNVTLNASLLNSSN